MRIMKDTTEMAYALREFLATQVGPIELEHMDSALFAGEPYCAMMSGFAVAYDRRLFIPQGLRDEYLTEVNWNEIEREELNGYLLKIPLNRAA